MYSIKYPVAFHPVDMAITRVHEGRLQVLLAQKIKDTDNKVWRFPGGFIDPWDSCAEEAALRESIEETGMEFVSPGTGLIAVNYFKEYLAKKTPLVEKLNKIIESEEKSGKANSQKSEVIKQLQEIQVSEPGLKWLRKNLSYIGSTKIDDVRYRDTDHKVITSLYELHPVSGEAGEGPFDDIARTKWFFLSEIKEELMHPSHKPLFEMLFNKYKAEKVADAIFEQADQMAKEVEGMFDSFKKSTDEIFKDIEKKMPEFEKKAKDTMDKVNTRFESIFKNLFD